MPSGRRTGERLARRHCAGVGTRAEEAEELLSRRLRSRFRPP
jgi:hypothetical protein